MSLISSLVYLIWQRKKRSGIVPDTSPKAKANSETSFVFGQSEMDSEATIRRELDAGEIRPELSGGHVLHEMAGDHGVTEMGNYDPKEAYELPGSLAGHIDEKPTGNWI
jgi:hypothetical protein